MGTARNFTVKTGLDIDDGDLTLTDGDILLTAGFLQSTPASGNPLKIDGSTISTLSGNHNINITPHGTGSVVIDTADIDGGTIDAVTIATSNITVGSGKTLNVSGGTLTTSQAQKLAIVEGVGADTDIGDFNFRASTLIADVADGTAPLTITSTTKVANLNVEQLDGSDWTAAPATTFGTDGSGVDVTFHSATSGDNMLWDTSAKQLKIVGTASSVALDVDTGDFTVGAYGLTNAGAATIASMAGNWTNAGRTVADAGILTTVDINGGSIDGTPINTSTIGATSHASGKFTTLQATGTSTLTLANTNLVTVNGTDRSQMTLLQANGTAGAGGSNNITTDERNYGEMRIRQKMGDGNLVHSQVEYMGGAYIIENNTNGGGSTGQGVVFTVGNNGASGSSAWAMGRQAATGKFAIGYSGKDYDNVKDSAQNPMRTGQEYLVLDVSGNLALTAPNTSFTFTSNASTGATEYTTGFKGSPSASGSIVYTLPVDHPSSDKVLQSTSAGVLSWVTGAAGGDANQSLTTGGGISGANDGSDGDFTIAVEAAQTTITSILAADLIIGEDAQTAIDFGTADEIDFKAANAVQLTLADGVFRPETDSDVDFGTTDIRWKDAFIDSIMTTANITVGDDLTLLSDGAILGFGANNEVKLTHVHDAGLLLNAGMQLQFKNANQNIYGDTTQLNLRSNAVIDLTAPAVNMVSTTAVAMTTPEVVITSTTTSKPTLTIQNTHDGTTGGELRFKSDDTSAGADGDDIGTISFYADDSGGNQTAFASILAEVSESLDSDEAGKLSFFIAESDGTNTAQTAALILEGEHATDGQVDVTIGAGAASTTTIVGNLVVNGATTTISTAQLTVEDDLITISKGNDSTANANASGVEIDVDTDGAGTGTNIAWIYNHATTAWQSNVDIDTSGTGNTYKINGTEVLNSDTLGTNIVNSTLTKVGALNEGSITSGFGTIDTGASTITTTGLISGGSLDIDHVVIDGTTIGHTNDTDLMTVASGLLTVAGEISVTTLDIGGANVTATAGELNYLDLTASIGTVTASEALVVDASRNLTNINNVTSTGALQGATLSVDAVAILDTASGDSATITGETNLFSIPKATYKAAKILYHIKKDDNNRTDAGEILVTHDGTNAFLTHYGQVSTDSAVVGTWDCTVNSANIEVRFTPTADGAHSYCLVATQLIVEP